MKIATFNIQSGVGTTQGKWQYITGSWKYAFPHSQAILPKIADFAKSQKIDLLTLSEVENSSFRSSRVNQTKIISDLSGLTNYRFFQTYKNIFANQGNSILSRYNISEFESFKLPGNGQPRYLGKAIIEINKKRINLLTTHLSLSKKYRLNQLEAIVDKISSIRGPVILTGDLNTEDKSEIEVLKRTTLKMADNLKTYPSWKPYKKLDYIFVSPDIKIIKSYLGNIRVSDHLPLITEVSL
jgi:endonuclease/exonuclease/phosphatase family metal-dependent hydrolase